LSGDESCSSVRVRYAETDRMGVAYHGSYFVWFEIARIDYLREHGLVYREMEEKQGLCLPVIDLHAQYRKPTFFDDVLEIRTRVAQVTGARVGFDYDVRRPGDPTVLATGHTAHAVVDTAGRPQRVPDNLRRALTT
jgi:acyl-CoA thioester hydrolase